MRIGIALAVAFNDTRVVALIIEGFQQCAGGEDAEGLLVEGIEPFHEAAGVDVASEPVEAGEQGAAIGESIEGYAVEHHVVLAIALGAERSLAGTEETGAGV